MKIFNIGDACIRLLQKSESIELFEMFAENLGLGPGLHFHRGMEEGFYVIFWNSLGSVP
ncbi:MAG: hypothetical protein P4L16_07955 [Chlamydiales bacterium]|nr:hypothetical protein [Chlamydiales bacterium]